MKNQRTASRVIVDGLVKQGVDIIFQVPGESFLPLLDSLRDSKVRTITCRHEAGAANMAEAYGKLTGRPGVCIVTRGPGLVMQASASTRRGKIRRPWCYWWD